MYISIPEMLTDIETSVVLEEKVIKLRKHASDPRFKLFLQWAFFNTKKPTITNIPEYKPNMVDVTFSYIKLEKAIQSLKFFFEGEYFIFSEKKRLDRMLSILEEISWIEAPYFEYLIMNKFNQFKNITLTKEFILQVIPDMKEIA